MPKLSLSRRHRRQTNLAQLNQDYGECSTLHRAAPRKVSEDEICQSTGENTCSTSSSSSELIAPAQVQDQDRPMLKRPAPSLCLVDLLTPRPEEEISDEHQDFQAVSPCSPWGHFVDILITQDDQKPHSRCFLPSCPTPSRDDPYPLKQRRNRKTKSASLDGFFLSAPSETDQLLDAASAKLNRLTVD